ncbi:hypothetical protein B0H14DRAFT_3614398 [Mycena olivaceomarginata]|nr:hypothetical protein B0H14DRAFT_3614398 [Mycena olivaceomarginata]
MYMDRLERRRPRKYLRTSRLSVPTFPQPRNLPGPRREVKWWRSAQRALKSPRVRLSLPAARMSARFTPTNAEQASATGNAFTRRIEHPHKAQPPRARCSCLARSPGRRHNHCNSRSRKNPFTIAVYVEHVPVHMAVGDNGQRKYFTELSELIPAAVEQDSPIKVLGGRLYRPNIREDSAQHLQIGTIDAVLAGKSRELQPTALNEYIMHHSHDGLFTCDLFWDN